MKQQTLGHEKRQPFGSCKAAALDLVRGTGAGTLDKAPKKVISYEK